MKPELQKVYEDLIIGYMSECTKHTKIAAEYMTKAGQVAEQLNDELKKPDLTVIEGDKKL